MVLIGLENMRWVDEKALEKLQAHAVNGIADVTLECLAKYCRVTPVTAHAVIRRLEEAGHIKRIGTRGHQRYQVNEG